MINVNQITAQLARMPDQALQQYASMHKNDPYTVSLALAESNRRKEMRTAAQGQQGMGDQPKVVDQGIAGMAAPAPQPQMPQAQEQPMPEDVGIGALPAPNMQGMAEGGIVAFGDGGDVQRFAGAGDSLVRSTTGGRDYFLDVPETIRDPSVPYYRQIPNPLASLAGKKFGSREEAAQAYNAAAGIPAAAATPAPAVVTPGVTPTGGIGNLSQPATAVVPAAAPAPAPGAGGPRAPMAPRAPDGPTDFASQFKATREATKEADPYAKETEDIGKAMVASKEEGLAGIKARQAASADIFKGKEANIASRSADVLRREDANVGLAWLNAGLAIMSTPGGLATAIGKGARVGTEQFAAGLDKINAAKDKIAEAQDRLEDLKIHRNEMSAKEIQDAETGIRETKITARGLGLQGLKDAGARNDKVAGHIFDATTKEKLAREDQASRERAAATTASAYSAGRLGVAEDRLALDRQKAQLTNLQKTLEGTSKHTPDGKIKRAQLERDMETLRNQIASGTIAAPSAVPPPGGSVLNFDAMGNLVK